MGAAGASAALVAALADPDRGWDAIVIGEYERAFYGNQYASMAPLFEHYAVSLWMHEVGGRVDWHAEDHEQTMLALGLSSKREITRTRVRVRTAMAPAPDRDRVDAANSGGDPGQPPLHGPAGMEQAAIQGRPGRPANTGLGHKQVQRWNLPDGWVISKHPAHAALVSEADFIAAQDATASRGPAGSAARQYLLAGLITCGRCGRRLESCWSNGKPAYRCRHGYSSATVPDPARPKNTYVQEDQILPHLAALAILLAGDDSAADRAYQVKAIAPAETADLIGQLNATGVVLTYDPDNRAFRAGDDTAIAILPCQRS
jgi:hypothetical protein